MIRRAKLPHLLRIWSLHPPLPPPTALLKGVKASAAEASAAVADAKVAHPTAEAELQHQDPEGVHGPDAPPFWATVIL